MFTRRIAPRIEEWLPRRPALLIKTSMRPKASQALCTAASTAHPPGATSSSTATANVWLATAAAEALISSQRERRRRRGARRRRPGSPRVPGRGRNRGRGRRRRPSPAQPAPPAGSMALPQRTTPWLETGVGLVVVPRCGLRCLLVINRMGKHDF